MKKTLLLIAFGATVLSAQAQVTLPTASPYTQDFNALPTIPAGWSVYTNASATSLGSVQPIYSSTHPSTPYVNASDTMCIAYVVAGGFRNYPSANVLTSGSDFCLATPPTFTDRAFGIRQVSNTNASFPNSDPGAAFVLKLNNTIGHKTFNLAFKLQSLDTSSSRVTTWTVDYAVATSATVTPTAFTPIAATGTMTTGGNTFSNDTIGVNFGTALDNKAFPVYIRIVALTPSTGLGNRPSSAIDDYRLTYIPDPNAVDQISAAPQLDLTVVGAATSSNVTFVYNAEEAGNYNFAIYDFTGRIVHQQVVRAQAGTQQLAVNGLNLSTGMYIAKMSNATASTVAKIIVQ
jgi:hypothetical protein